MEGYITLNGQDYELAKTLRVAYKLQGQHNHKSYSEIFSQVNSMTLEEQIGIVWIAFSVANPEEAKTITQKVFLDLFLDNYDLGDLMAMIEYIIKGIMGKELYDQAEEAIKQGEEDETENFHKN